MADATKKEVKISLKPKGAIPPASGANYFQVTRVGDEWQLIVGSFDLIPLSTLIGEEKDGEIPVEISHRFLLSETTMQRLYATVTEIMDKTKTQREQAKKAGVV